MEMMKEINKRADEYEPAKEVAEEGMKNMMLKAMDAERHKRKLADVEDSSKKQTKPKHTKEYIKMMQA